MTFSPLIKVNHVCKDYRVGDEQLNILKDICFSIKQQQTVAIMGPSGSGKSTLLSILAGLILPTSGRVEVEDGDLSSQSADQRALWRKNNVGFIFQGFELIPHFTVIENVMLPLELKGAQNCRQKARQCLAQVGMEHRENFQVQQLSGGESQRVAIARAFVANPKIIFADEPTGSLDNKNAIKVVDTLWQQYEKNKASLIIVTHNAEIAKICQYQYSLSNGVLSQC